MTKKKKKTAPNYRSAKIFFWSLFALGILAITAVFSFAALGFLGPMAVMVIKGYGQKKKHKAANLKTDVIHKIPKSNSDQKKIFADR